MAPRRPKRPTDANQLGKLVVDLSTGTLSEQDSVQTNEFARQGGLKGGRARAKALSSEERKAIARKAARQRWKSQKEPAD